MKLEDTSQYFVVGLVFSIPTTNKKGFIRFGATKKVETLCSLSLLLLRFQKRMYRTTKLILCQNYSCGPVVHINEALK